MNTAGSSLEEITTRLRAVEDALAKCERLATASRYAGAVMHEVNNPLEALSNLIYLTERIANDPEVVRQNMQMAEDQLRVLTNITRKTLSFYRDQAEPKPYDLAEIVESALKIHQHRVFRNKIEVRKRMHGPAVAVVYASEILQVLSNLIINSLDALPGTEAVLCLRVRRCGERVHITIADNGSGVEPAVLDKIFEPHVTTKDHGTGLGLWLSRKIAEKHDGSITCRSSQRAGRTGTTFKLSLPAA